MSYQVLARKWRPTEFNDLVGQQHVLRALINALDSNRIHHAFLFSGTRGVGKTTIARIFAKSLNCEQGISSTPCGKCSTCVEIDNGHFVDLIEVDAASRTKVEDTRELLDNVQYAPSRGTYKVYLIDEVHMLSNHSFNALLKTLEEPPPHVKFLLATTDPQKIPITILSRCLQFNLKRLPLNNIEDYLKLILEKESIEYEQQAIKNISIAADGSMRDALSILDQGISFSNGLLTESDMNVMLGNIEQSFVYTILEALSKKDADLLIDCIQKLSAQAPDYTTVLSDILTNLHNIALVQQIPNAYDENMGDKEKLQNLIVQLNAEDIQLFYQIALIGQRDMLLAPSQKIGFQMVLLRMLAFCPESNKKKPSKPLNVESFDNKVIIKSRNPDVVAPEVSAISESTRYNKTTNISTIKNASSNINYNVYSWSELVTSLKITGLDKQLLINCVFLSYIDNCFKLTLSPNNSSLYAKDRELRIKSILCDTVGIDINVSITIEESENETLFEINERQNQDRNNKANDIIQNDPNVRDILDTFSGSINKKSIKPIN